MNFLRRHHTHVIRAHIKKETIIPDVPSPLFKSAPLPRDNCCPDLYLCALTWPVFELYINAIVQYVPLCLAVFTKCCLCL